MAEPSQTKALTLAITGASGSPYALRLLQCLLEADWHVHLLLSSAALIVLDTEVGLSLSGEPKDMQQQLLAHYALPKARLSVYGKEEWTAPVASGSANVDAMVVCPCSMGTLSAIACGASNNLIERAADVSLKEGRQLILVPRESPLSSIHLENMLKLSRMGVAILPASPGFYQRPESIQDLVDFVVARVLSQLGVEQSLLKPWGE
jgi:4-hydroxy-3-polyprenylbenzoate decarboxylase